MVFRACHYEFAGVRCFSYPLQSTRYAYPKRIRRRPDAPGVLSGGLRRDRRSGCSLLAWPARQPTVRRLTADGNTIAADSAASGKSGAARPPATTSRGTRSPCRTASTPATPSIPDHALLPRPRLVSHQLRGAESLPQRPHAAALRRRRAEERSLCRPGDASGEHVGGYDELTVDITDAAARAAKRPTPRARCSSPCCATTRATWR